jgi:hypothetical protein
VKTRLQGSGGSVGDEAELEHADPVLAEEPEVGQFKKRCPWHADGNPSTRTEHTERRDAMAAGHVDTNGVRLWHQELG